MRGGWGCIHSSSEIKHKGLKESVNRCPGKQRERQFMFDECVALNRKMLLFTKKEIHLYTHTHTHNEQYMNRIKFDPDGSNGENVFS